jgi:hypothetical protein
MNDDAEIEIVEGGEEVCYAHLLCDECGAVLDGTHEQPCPTRDVHEKN